MDLSEQLKKLFPNHQPLPEKPTVEVEKDLFIQKDPIICQYEKRHGKPTTIIAGYSGDTEDFKLLAKAIKTKFSVGGSFKDEQLIIQGNFRDQIMAFLKDKGFKVKRVGG
jgi:translation initiation factor 1